MCGNNLLCSKPLNNTCNARGSCLTAQCPVCPNGMQGGDCTCRTGPPTSPDYSALNASCEAGTWVITGDLYGSLYIAPGSSVTIIGTLYIPSNHTLTMGSGSHLDLTSCLAVDGAIQGVYSPKFPGIGVVQFDPDCSSQELVNTTLSIVTFLSDRNDKCTEALSESSFDAPGLLNVIFSTKSKCNDKKKFNYILYVVTPVVAVLGATAIVTASIIAYQHHQEKKAKIMPGL